MTERICIDVVAHDFDVATRYQDFARVHSNGDVGAIACFIGVARDTNYRGKISKLTIECYRDMAVRQIEKIAIRGLETSGAIAATVIHRYGDITPGQPIVLVMAASSHRKASFRCTEEIMDYLKGNAPFWKLEHDEAGSHWVEAKHDDERPPID